MVGTKFLLAATTALSTGASEPDFTLAQAETHSTPYSELADSCNTAFELSPHGTLEPGTNIWVREPDLRDDGVAPACTSAENIEERQDANVDDGDNPAIICTVGPSGLDLGPGPFAGPDDDTPPLVMRDEKGICFIPSELTM